LKKLIRKRDCYYNRWKKSKSPSVRQHFKALKTRVQKGLRTAYWDYVESLITTNDAGTTYENKINHPGKRFWTYIKTLRKGTSGTYPLRENGLLVNDSKGKAEILNRQYSSVFTEEDLTHTPDLGDSPLPTMASFTITTPGVQKLLAELDPNKACGPDELRPKILKELASPLAPILASIFNKSINSGSVPNDWKLANITPIFKKGERFKPSNYRPVSLTCICSKLLEHNKKHFKTPGNQFHSPGLSAWF
jgi:hypothetical protein